MNSSSYAEGVAAKVLLPGEPLAAHAAGEGPLSGVTADVPLHDPLLLGRVRAERTLVEFHRHHQTVTCRGHERQRVSVKASENWLRICTGNASQTSHVYFSVFFK